MSGTETGLSIDYREIAEEHMQEGGMFVYSHDSLQASAEELLALNMPYGTTVRYAAKANPHEQIVRQFDEMGLHFDASSVNEADMLIGFGVPGDKISLSSQVLRWTPVLEHALAEGVKPVATSLRQIGMLGEAGCRYIAVRVNPGIGSGHNNRTNVGGPSSSFGIWHEQIPDILHAAASNGQAIDRVHTHIGSGADPDIWRTVIRKSLDVVSQFPDVTTLDIGGGYKVARMPEETKTDMEEVGRAFAEELEAFAVKTGREIKLEIEPGSYLVANAGVLLGRIEEVVGTDQYEFLRLNVGMNALLRPSLYGAQHPIDVLNDSSETRDYVVVGPCCESGDILTPAPGDPEGISPRKLSKADVGDFVVIGGAGAYGKTMASRDYNHVPAATEIYAL